MSQPASLVEVIPLEPSQETPDPGGPRPSFGPSGDGDLLDRFAVARHLAMSIRIVDRWANGGRIPSAFARDGSRIFRLAQLANLSVRTDPGRAG